MFRQMALRLGALLALSVALVACGVGTPAAGPAATRAAPSVAPATRPPAATVRPTGVSAASPVPASPAPAEAAALAQGLTPEGYHFLGRADAPLTLVNYSDFL